MRCFRLRTCVLNWHVPHRWLVCAFVALGFFWAPVTLVAQSGADQSTDIRDMVRTRVDVQKTHKGLVVGVVDAHGHRTFAHGQTKDQGVPVDSSTVFEIGSLTKVFTGLLLADAVEQGELSLATPVEQHLPPSVPLPAPEDTEITYRHLVTHTSGLPRLPSNLAPVEHPNDPYAQYTVRDLYRALDQIRLDEPPGRAYDYSNLGFGLLGHALAQVYDTTYTSLVETRVTQPLGLSRTASAPDSSLLAHAAIGHDAAGRVVPSWTFTEATAGAGILHGSATDMLSFLAVQLGLRTVSDPVDDAIERSHTILYEGEDQKIAYGWHVRRIDGSRVFWHNGRTGGFASFMAFDPARDIGVVVLANSSRSVDDIGMKLLNQKAPLKSTGTPHR